MAAIYLIRHGQASFGKADYDQLSDVGCQQSALLGEFWHALPAPDKVYTGDLLRHGQTLSHFYQGYQGKQPSVILHSGFNEFNHVDMLMCYDKKWHSFAAMSDAIGKQPDANKHFQKEFSSAMERWVSGKHDKDYKESWQQFNKRCISALFDVINQELNAKSTQQGLEPAKNICIFTSGGTISVILAHILGLSVENTLAINQQLRNTSVSKLLFSDNHLSVDFINSYHHLLPKGEEWVTFR